MTHLPLAVAFLIPKLYAITVLSSLNARPVIHDLRKDDTIVEKGAQFSLAQVSLSFVVRST